MILETVEVGITLSSQKDISFLEVVDCTSGVTFGWISFWVFSC